MSRVLISELKTAPSKQDKPRTIPNLASISKNYANPSKNQKPTQNKQQTDNKPITNRQQFDNNSITNRQQFDNNSITNRQQFDNNSITNRQQFDNNSITIRQQFDNGNDNTFDNNSITIRQQFDNNSTTEPTTKLTEKTTFLCLAGIQRSIMEFIYSVCRSKGSRTSPPIPNVQLASIVGSSLLSVKMSASRLIKKNILIRVKYKAGRGGWTQYRLPENIYNELLHLDIDNTFDNKPITNRQQTDNKPITEPITEPITNRPSSSSSYLNITTTTGTDEKGQLSGVNIPNCIKEVGFNDSHLRQLEKVEGIDAGNVRESLEHFAHDLEKGILKIRTSPVAFLMGIFRKGNEYTSADYAGELEREINAHLAELERREGERAEKKQRIEELLFSEWLENKTDGELEKLVPPITGAIRGEIHLRMLKAHFLAEEMEDFKKVFFAKETGRERGEETASCPN